MALPACGAALRTCDMAGPGRARERALAAVLGTDAGIPERGAEGEVVCANGEGLAEVGLGAWSGVAGSEEDDEEIVELESDESEQDCESESMSERDAVLSGAL